MKKTYIVFLLLFLHMFSAAQKSQTDTERFLMQILEKQSASYNTAQKTTSTMERLVAQSDYGLGLSSATQIFDSLFLIYNSNSRGSVFNFDVMSYGLGASQTYEPITPLFGAGMGTIPEYAQPIVKFDSAVTWSLTSPTLTYGLYSNESSKYDANNNLLDYQYLPVSTISYRTVNAYNSFSDLTISYSYTGAPGFWNATQYALFNYTGPSLATDSTNIPAGAGGWNPGEKYVYSYDGSGNLTEADGYLWSGSWLQNERYLFSYYPGNMLKTYLQDENITGAGAFKRIFTDSFGYAPGYSFYSYQRHILDTNGVVSDTIINTKHIPASSLPDTLYSRDNNYAGSGTAFTTMIIYTYDSYNEPKTATTYRDPGIAVTPSTYGSETFYYYELYNNTTGIQNAGTVQDKIKIYPGPAINTLFIAQTGATGNTLNINIINAAGQRIFCEKIPSRNEIEQISISSFIPGMYCIIVQDGDGVILHREAFIKQ